MKKQNKKTTEEVKNVLDMMLYDYEIIIESNEHIRKIHIKNINLMIDDLKNNNTVFNILNEEEKTEYINKFEAMINKFN